jgi:lipoate---protein ligase
VLGLVTAPAAELLAAGATDLDALADDPVPTLRWYRATDTAVVLGRGQRADLLAEGDLPVVMRSSGGGAVLMDAGLLSLDVLLPAGHPLLDGDLGAVFGRVGHAWAGALADLGVADLAVHDGPAQARRGGNARERLLASVCYATLGRGEVTAGGRKLVGLAQRRRRPGALVQCGLLRRWDPRALLRRLGADPDDPGIVDAAVGLDDLLAAPPTDQAVMAAVSARLTG